MLLAVKFEAFKVTSDNDKSRGVLQITIWQNSPKGHNCLPKSRLSLAQTRCHDDLYQISAHTKKYNLWRNDDISGKQYS